MKNPENTLHEEVRATVALANSGGGSVREIPVAFEEFSKIARLSRDCTVTEKIDGTNAQVYVAEDGTVRAGSRNRWLTIADDNFGFARWVAEHEEELRVGLGVGRHFGEWWGSGIQRRYGLDHKRFSLFNTARWVENRRDGNRAPLGEKQQYAPQFCHVVPILYRGLFTTERVGSCIERLRTLGSVAAPGFKNPEGVVVWHEHARVLFKKTLIKDEVPKALAGQAV
jgi:hypothetical protein